jgi:hypothetical protein
MSEQNQEQAPAQEQAAPTREGFVDLEIADPIRVSMPRDLFEGLTNVFTYHPPKNDQGYRYDELRAAGKRFAAVILGMTPESPEQAQAINRLREAVMWANAAIACRE